MPRRKKITKKTKKRPVSKFRKNTTIAHANLGSGIPDSMTVKLTYADQFTLDPGVGGTPATYVFRANGCNDPDYTGTGHQPYGWDEYTTLYNHYIVLGSKIELVATNSGDDTNSMNLISLYVSANSTVASNALTDVLERPNQKYILVGARNAGPKKLWKNFSAKRFFDLTDLNDNRDHMGAAVNADPTEQAYFIVAASPYQAGVNTNATACTIKITYIVRFSERKNLTQS